MRKKTLLYALIPMVAGAVLLGANFASARGAFGGFGFGGGLAATPDEMATRHQAMFQEQANLLGVSVDDVKNAWAQGKNIWDLAKEKGISQEQLQQKMKDARVAQMKTQLQVLVDKGVITQAQADQRLKFMQDMPNKAGKAKGPRGHMGFGL